MTPLRGQNRGYEPSETDTKRRLSLLNRVAEQFGKEKVDEILKDDPALKQLWQQSLLEDVAREFGKDKAEALVKDEPEIREDWERTAQLTEHEEPFWTERKKAPDKLWYLVPVLFSFLGGLIAYVALKDEDDRQGTRKITSIKIIYRGKEMPARVVDTGDADVEVHSGDWAIIKTQHDLDLPSLHVDPAFPYDFAEPIFRLGNDYSKGIMLSTGYVGQRTANGLITCLTDGHPGVSGGGILNQRGDLVGIPIGRMQGDYRFSFILPIRGEMLRKLPSYEPPATPSIVATDPSQEQQQ